MSDLSSRLTGLTSSGTFRRSLTNRAIVPHPFSCSQANCSESLQIGFYEPKPGFRHECNKTIHENPTVKSTKIDYRRISRSFRRISVSYGCHPKKRRTEVHARTYFTPHSQVAPGFYLLHQRLIIYRDWFYDGPALPLNL